jgi:hypothetical protein
VTRTKIKINSIATQVKVENDSIFHTQAMMKAQGITSSNDTAVYCNGFILLRKISCCNYNQ